MGLLGRPSRRRLTHPLRGTETPSLVPGPAITAFAFMLTLSCSAPKTLHAAAPLACPKTDGLAELAVAAAEAAFPGPLDADKIDRRRTYINLNLARLFDPNGTGYLNLQRYEDWQWAGFLVSLPSSTCAINFQQYRYFLEGYGSTEEVDKFRPFTAKVDAITFAQISRDGEYITRQDLTRQWFEPSFHNFEKDGSGRAPLSGRLAELFGKKGN